MGLYNPSIGAVLAILAITVLFSLFYIFRLNKIRLLRFFVSKPGALHIYFIEKLIGFVLFGLVPFLLFNVMAGAKAAESGLKTGTSGQYWYLLLILLVFISLLTFFTSKQKTFQERYPQLRLKNWSVRYSLISFSGWILYILGYEFCFRGILLLACYRAWGLWPALVINIILYSIAHLDQGLLMSLGAIPVGVIFCLLTILTGSFLFAFIIHSWMAVSNEIFSIYHNPELSFRLKGERI
jgi:membrane protease YdiL (CAAX protease family)